MDTVGKMEQLIAVQRAVAKRDWDEIEKELKALTETIVEDCIKPAVIERTYIPSFSAGYTRYAGNSGLSGGCMPAAA